MVDLDWKRAAGCRWLADAPAGEAPYEVLAAYVAYTCDESGAFDGEWSSDALGTFEEARDELASRVRAGRFGFVGAGGPIELFRVRDGLDMCMGDGRGLAVACDWRLYSGDEQLGRYRSADEAMAAACGHAAGAR